MFELKRIAYSYNNMLENPFYLDALVQKDDQVLIDVHEAFETKEAFFTKINEIIPILE